jgi:hypothetical protein
MDEIGWDGRAVRCQDSEGFQIDQGPVKGESSYWINEIAKQQESFLNTQEEREKALLVLTNTVKFMEKLMNERGTTYEPQSDRKPLQSETESTRKPS